MADFLSNGTGTKIMTEMGFYDLANKVVKKMFNESKGIKRGKMETRKLARQR